MSYRYGGSLNRTICSVFEDMRKLDQTKNYGPILGLIEEAQMLANRMEAKLYDIKDLESLNDKYKKLRKECEELEKKKDETVVSKTEG
jgi:hypothetical protein